MKHVDQSQVPSVPKPLMVVTPTDAGVYPVAVFLHGCSMFNSWMVREPPVARRVPRVHRRRAPRSVSVVAVLVVAAVLFIFLSCSENTSASRPRLITARRHHPAARHERLEGHRRHQAGHRLARRQAARPGARPRRHPRPPRRPAGPLQAGAGRPQPRRRHGLRRGPRARTHHYRVRQQQQHSPPRRRRRRSSSPP